MKKKLEKTKEVEDVTNKLDDKEIDNIVTLTPEKLKEMANLNHAGENILVSPNGESAFDRITYLWQNVGPEEEYTRACSFASMQIIDLYRLGIFSVDKKTEDLLDEMSNFFKDMKGQLEKPLLYNDQGGIVSGTSA